MPLKFKWVEKTSCIKPVRRWISYEFGQHVLAMTCHCWYWPLIDFSGGRIIREWRMQCHNIWWIFPYNLLEIHWSAGTKKVHSLYMQVCRAFYHESKHVYIIFLVVEGRTTNKYSLFFYWSMYLTQATGSAVFPFKLPLW